MSTWLAALLVRLTARPMSGVLSCRSLPSRLPLSTFPQLLQISGIHLPSDPCDPSHPLSTHQQWSARLYSSLRDIKSYEFSSVERISPHDYTRVMTAYH